MKLDGNSLRFSATDLSNFLNCRHLTTLEKQVTMGAANAPYSWDPLLDVLWERGHQHEQNYVRHLKAKDAELVEIRGVDISDETVAATIAAMHHGARFIIQGAFRSGDWVGRPDMLIRVDRPSSLGDWSYEPLDTKLSRETKGSTILQLSLYADLIGKVQGVAPEHMHVVPPWSDFDQPESWRVADFAAYYRRVKAAFELAAGLDAETYPEPVEHCLVCRWQRICDKRRRDDDHLSLVAGISKVQRGELGAHGVETMAQLAAMPIPLQWKPERGARASYERVREQARLQVDARESGQAKVELIPFVAEFGLARLPEPDSSDIFLDFEGDAFVGDSGLEYLLGYQYRDDDGVDNYVPLWALNRQAEKTAFETFIDFVMARWANHPGLHIYHFGGYESGALKRLMGRYATREEELDHILRGQLLVDLLSVTKQGVRAGVESYSIKKLEPLYGFAREVGLPDANLALTRLQVCLELGEPEGIEEEDRETVQSYNRDDCASTRALRDWLEVKRAELIATGVNLTRPRPAQSDPTENIAEWLVRITPLFEALTANVPVDSAERAPEQHARWLLANLLGWHRREDKAVWWEYYRHKALSADELMDEKGGLSGLAFVERVGGTAACPIDRYSFPVQEADVRPGDGLCLPGSGANLGTIVEISREQRTVDIRKTRAMAEEHPEAAYRHNYVSAKPMAEALIRIAEYVVANGMTGDGPYRAARDMLLRVAPVTADKSPLRLEGETTLNAGKRVAAQIGSGVLPIQGPPGTGKTFTGAHMICALVAQGRKIGIVANGHEVIRNMLDKVIEVADETGIDVCCVQKPKEKVPNVHRIRMAKSAEDALTALKSDCQVCGGTAWLWARPDAIEAVDVLFVDEAAQMSLANAVAVAQAAQTVVLIGDPQQLDQPTQGTHPDGTGGSALDHLLNGAQTISSEQGLFLDVTWRLHPNICAFTSELFYEGKLEPLPGLELQRIEGLNTVAGAGLRFFPVTHDGNQNSSPEEADMIKALVDAILATKARWIDRKGNEKQIALDEIMIITPYNAQVFEILKRLPDARVGTVDKFQGQEAPIAIYSLASSSQTDAPRGMEFLYSLNRLNVATSRARCVSALVGSPNVFEADCRSPRQMQLANAFSRYLEMAN